jgi:hypothetical protein
MRLNYVFMIIINIFIPLTGLLTIREFFETSFNSLESNNFFTNLSKNLGSMGGFFLKYLMQITFVSTSFHLLDIPHFFVKSIRKCCHKNKKEPFKDTWYFDIGFNQSYSSTMYLLAIIFTTLMPLSSFFGFLFFFYKFYVTKYNFIYVYIKEFEGSAKLRKTIINTTIFTIIFY